MIEQTDFIVTVRGRRGEEMRRVLGTDRVCVASPVPQVAQVPIGVRRVYLLHLPSLTPEQRSSLERHLAEKFDLPIDEVRAELDDAGLPILADDCDLTVLNPQRWLT